MNIELDEVIVEEVPDDALELAASGAQLGFTSPVQYGPFGASC